MEISLKKRLNNGDKLIGTWTEGSSETAVEILGLAGFDFVIIDNEHGCHTNPNLNALVRAAEVRNMAPIIRVPGPYVEDYIKKALDMGASGILVPNITNREDAELSVRYSKFAPLGNRGCCPYLRSNYYGTKYGTIDYYAEANDEVTTILLIENIEAVKNFEEIITVDGIDAIFIGPVDLSVSMGIPGQLDNEELVDAINYMIDKSHKNGIKIGMFCDGAERVLKWINKLDYITNGIDMNILLEASKNQLRAFRKATNELK